jgi:hypothetical protein
MIALQLFVWKKRDTFTRYMRHLVRKNIGHVPRRLGGHTARTTSCPRAQKNAGQAPRRSSFQNTFSFILNTLWIEGTGEEYLQIE